MMSAPGCRCFAITRSARMPVYRTPDPAVRPPAVPQARGAADSRAVRGGHGDDADGPGARGGRERHGLQGAAPEGGSVYMQVHAITCIGQGRLQHTLM